MSVGRPKHAHKTACTPWHATRRHNTTRANTRAPGMWKPFVGTSVRESSLSIVALPPGPFDERPTRLPGSRSHDTSCVYACVCSCAHACVRMHVLPWLANQRDVRDSKVSDFSQIVVEGQLPKQGCRPFVAKILRLEYRLWVCLLVMCIDTCL